MFHRARASVVLNLICLISIGYAQAREKVQPSQGRYCDLTDKLKEVRSAQEVRRESAAERATLNRHTLVLEPLDRPASHELRITFLGVIERESVPGVYPSALPALWKPGIQRYFRDSLTSLKTAYAKEGLRGMSFGDEINTHRVSLFGAGTPKPTGPTSSAARAARKTVSSTISAWVGSSPFPPGRICAISSWS